MKLGFFIDIKVSGSTEKTSAHPTPSLLVMGLRTSAISISAVSVFAAFCIPDWL